MPTTAGDGYFGNPDGYYDRRSFKSFYPIDAFSTLKSEPGGTKYIITGVFGCGKTAILAKIANNAKVRNELVWEYNEHNIPQNQLNYSRLDDSRGTLLNATLNLMLWQLTNEILKSPDSFPKAALAKAKELFPNIVERIGLKLARGTKLKGGVIELDGGKVFEDKGATVSQTLPLDEWKKALGLALAAVPNYILLDDIEIIFPGIEESAPAADALLSAIVELNDLFGENLTVLTSLQYTTYTLLTRESKKFDKIRFIEEIAWTPRLDSNM
jgi:hypothetical protein